MPYNVHQLAKLAGVTVRTLHYYDEVGLLKPARIKSNGYRQYEEPELLKLQQIMFFRELDFPIENIKSVMSSPTFDMRTALSDQKKLIELKKKRLTSLVQTIDRTVRKLDKKNTMNDQELYGSFSKKEMEQYAEEARQRWGHTDAYKQSTERVKKLGKVGLARVAKESDELMKEIAANVDNGADSPAVQKLIERHYTNLHNFYEPNLKMYRGLGEMYVADPRFTAYFEKYRPGLALFMKEAIEIFCEAKTSK